MSSIEKAADDGFLVRLIVKDFSIDPDEITHSLGLRPEVSWKRGDPKVTPIGRVVPGLRSDNLWSYSSGGKVGRRFDGFVVSFVEDLDNCKALFERLRDDGARVELMLCLFGTKNTSGVLPARALGILFDLNVSIGVEVYPG